MRQIYNKLIRDKIPEIIEQSGYDYVVTTYSDAEYIEALRQKLIEESQEAAVASGKNELIKELADLYEVIDSLLLATGIKRETVLKQQQQRREQRGGFRDKLKLLWTEKTE